MQRAPGPLAAVPGQTTPPAPPALHVHTGATPAASAISATPAAQPQPQPQPQPRPQTSAQHALASLAEVVQTTFAYMPATLSGYFAGVCVVLVLFWVSAPAMLITGWLIAWALMGAGQIGRAHV